MVLAQTTDRAATSHNVTCDSNSSSVSRSMRSRRTRYASRTDRRVRRLSAHRVPVGRGRRRSQAMLARSASVEPPPWLAKLIAAQLADEHRHAGAPATRLAELGTASPRKPPALARAKLWWLERACAPYLRPFAAGPIVVMLAVAARFEATGVRVFARHLARARSDRRCRTLDRCCARSSRDERRHAKSCAAAAKRLVRDDGAADVRERSASESRRSIARSA